MWRERKTKMLHLKWPYICRQEESSEVKVSQKTTQKESQDWDDQFYGKTLADENCQKV